MEAMDVLSHWDLIEHVKHCKQVTIDKFTTVDKYACDPKHEVVINIFNVSVRASNALVGTILYVWY